MSVPRLFRPMNGSTPGMSNAVRVRNLQAENATLNKQKNALVRLLVAIAIDPAAVVPTDDGLTISRLAFAAAPKGASVRLQLTKEFVEVHVQETVAEPEPSRIVLPGA